MYPQPVPSAAPPKPYTVSELLAEVSGVLRTTWRNVAVVGEIARCEVRNGHCYFTLKDRTATLSAILFASDLQRVPFKLEIGLEVVIRGSLDLYTPQGKFQIKAYAVEPVGRGALQLAFEQLKAKLAAEGLFNPAHKRAIPRLPRSIAVVTSPTGAVVRDILHVLRRRFDGLGVTIYPVRVQGELAAREIVVAIRSLNLRGGFDVLILARGGGSPEDLAPFNDEAVARALAASRIPTICGVGHETDVTIADLVADLRAPTPSAAAELVCASREEIERRLSQSSAQLLRAMRARLALERSRVTGLSRSDALAGFPRRVRSARDFVEQSRETLLTRLRRRPAEYAARVLAARRFLESFTRVVQIPRLRDSVEGCRSMLRERIGRRVDRRRARLRELTRRLDALSPLAVLARGFAVAYREGAKRPILAAQDVAVGERLRVRLHRGELGVIVRDGGKWLDPGPLFAGPSEPEPEEEKK
ncbi:MAG TPA: exodeoxyribonuclease VII large subunit [Thermoanaerobaculia bacterium]|jgi:exodeoxyribonuclease VII large subunit